MKKIYAISLVLGIFVTILAIFTVNANANPSQFGILFTSDTGGTLASPTYTLAGKATSTISIKSQSGVSDKYEKAIIQFQVTSTSSAPTVLFKVETSFDNTNWFAYKNATSTSALATTVHSFTFASTTYDGYNDPSADSTKNNGSFTIDIPAPYVRVKAFSPIGNPAYNFYMSAKPIRESK